MAGAGIQKIPAPVSGFGGSEMLFQNVKAPCQKTERKITDGKHCDSCAQTEERCITLKSKRMVQTVTEYSGKNNKNQWA